MSSDMAVVWCIEHGVFPLAEAKKMTAAYLKAKERLRSRKVTSSSGAKAKAAKRSAGPAIVQEATVSDAAVGMSSTAVEGVGTTTL